MNCQKREKEIERVKQYGLNLISHSSGRKCLME